MWLPNCCHRRVVDEIWSSKKEDFLGVCILIDANCARDIWSKCKQNKSLTLGVSVNECIFLILFQFKLFYFLRCMNIESTAKGHSFHRLTICLQTVHTIPSHAIATR